MRIIERETGLLVHAPAKINLSLRVLGKRADGFHELETVFASVSLYDTLQFEPDASKDISLSILATSRTMQQTALPTDSRNLIVRAAELLREETGIAAGARIQLWKRVPLEAGLGGGSSDAAATLLALNQMWQAGCTKEQLHRLAAKLGSDVNFFLDSCPLGLGRGRGESVTPLHCNKSLHAVIVKPPSGLSTKRVFQELNAAPVGSEMPRRFDPEVWHGNGDVRQLVQNDLQPVACRLNADVERVLSTLLREGAWAASLSGSGSACFALCRTQREARVLAARLRAMRLGEVYCVSLAV